MLFTMPSTAYILALIVISSAGLAYFVYGKRQNLIVPRLCGIALMIYPYFVDSFWPMLGVGALFMALPFLIKS